MQVRTLFLGVGLALGLAGSAAAQTIVDGSSLDEILNIAKG